MNLFGLSFLLFILFILWSAGKGFFYHITAITPGTSLLQGETYITGNELDNSIKGFLF